VSTTVDEQVEIEPDTGDEDDEHEGDDLPAEPEPDDEPEAEAVPEPAALTEKELEKAQNALAKEATAHANRVSKIMGEAYLELTVCPMCVPNIPGYYFGEFIPDDTRQAVLSALDVSAASDLPHDPEAQVCDTCQGHGKTITGSLVLEHLTKMCPECKGMGWSDATTRRQYETVRDINKPIAPVVPIVAAALPVGSTTPYVDEWGRVQGHWAYGRDPKYLTADERANDIGATSA